MVKNGCDQSSYGTLKLNVSEEWRDRISWLFECDTWSQKLKADQPFFGWAWLKMDVASLLTGLKNEQMESSHYEFRKAKSWFKYFWVNLVKNGHDFLFHETLKSLVP